MNWLRLHHEARTDKKLATLTDKQFRVWFNLLCLAGEQKTRGIIPFDDFYLLAIEVSRGDTTLLERTIDQLVKLKILSMDGDEIAFINFDKRQYDKPSDSPERVSARVRKHRNTNETPMKRDVTPGNTIEQNRADTEQTTAEQTAPASPKASNGHDEAAAASSYQSVIGESTCTKVAEQFKRLDPVLVPAWFGGMLSKAQSQCGPAHRPQLEEAVKVTLSEVERRLAAEKNGGGGVPVVSVKKFTEAVFLRNLSDALGVAR